MNMVSRKLIVVLLAVMLFTSACGQRNMSSPAIESSPAKDTSGQEGNEAIAEDGSIELSNSNDENIEQAEEIPVFTSIIFETDLEENSTATAIISPEGGSLTTTAADGTQYTLVVPEGALLYEEEISMTPISSAVGEVIGDFFLGGVKLDPEGLHFLELVSIEVVKPGIKEGAFGFTGQSEEQDFHMIPSTSGDDSVTITTTHFTEFVISQDKINGALELGELASTAWLEHQLANGGESDQLAALDKMINELIYTGEQGIDVKNWGSWTSDILTLLLRNDELASKNKWDSDTSGFKEIISGLQNLVDLWFEKSEAVAQELSEKCTQGEIIYSGKFEQLYRVGVWLANNLKLEGENDYLVNWDEMLKKCYNFKVAWQGNVVAKGSDFISDISIGSETEINYVKGVRQEELVVEYLDGFWHDACEEQKGMIQFVLDIPNNSENFGLDLEVIYEGIIVKVKILKNVYIDCGLGLILSAKAQEPFHGAALERLNSPRRDEAGFWEFEIEYQPGGGVIGQFEEGPETLSWSEGTYELWQLVTVYNATPPD